MLERAAIPPLEDQPTRDLLKDLVDHGQLLVREELRLARLELKEEVKTASRAGVAIAGGGVLMHAALFALVAALVLLFAKLLPAWAASLIVAAIVGVVGGALLAIGRSKLKRLDVKPEQTVQTLKEDARWAKRTMRDIQLSRHANA